MKDIKINILGSVWDIRCVDEKDDDRLNGKFREGLSDCSTREIVICNKKEDCELCDYESWKKVILRHEIIHAFLFESGLDGSSQYCGAWASNEEMVDWIALQSPKIFKVFSELDILDDDSKSIIEPRLDVDGEIKKLDDSIQDLISRLTFNPFLPLKQPCEC